MGGRPTEPAVGDWADRLSEFLDALGVQSAHVLGLSWGGLLAQELYRRDAARVRSLVLADTYAGWKGSLPEPIPEERLAACLRDSFLAPGEFVPNYLPGMFSESATREARKELGSIMADFHPIGFRLMATALALADTRDLLPTIRVPTLLVWGDADARSPMTVAHQLYDAIPGAKLAVIPGAGHISNLEKPVQFDLAVPGSASRSRIPTCAESEPIRSRARRQRSARLQRPRRAAASRAASTRCGGSK